MLNICTFMKIKGNISKYLKKTSAGHKVITELFKSKGRIDGAAKKLLTQRKLEN